jgi:hypothetical protein
MGSYEIFTNAVILLQGKITMHETLPVEFREANATLFASKPDEVMKKNHPVRTIKDGSLNIASLIKKCATCTGCRLTNLKNKRWLKKTAIHSGLKKTTVTGNLPSMAYNPLLQN